MLKIISIRKLLSYSLTFIIIIIVLIYNFLFSSYFWNHYIKSQLNDIYRETLTIDFKVEDISLFRGLEIENIRIYDKITDTPIVFLKKLRLKYFLLGVLNGDIGIREFLLEEPKIYLYKINDRWNYESFNLKQEQKELPKEEKTELPDAIHLFIPIRLFFYFNVKDFALHYKVSKKEDNIENIIEELDLQGISFSTGLITKRFSKVDLNYKILSIIDDFLISLNPNSDINFLFKKNHNISGKPIISIQIYRSNNSENQFLTKIQIDTKDLSISSFNTSKEIITQFIWDIDYKPEEQKIQIHEISLMNPSGYLLFLNGEIKYIENDWYFSITQKEVTNKQFSLNLYGEVLSILTNNQLLLNGLISIDKFNLEGELSNLKIDILTNIPYFRFNNHFIQNLNLKLNGNLDLGNYLSPSHNDQNKNNHQKNLAFNVIQFLNLENLSLIYNGALIKLYGNIKESIDINLAVNNFNLGQFLNPFFTGNLNGRFIVNSDYDLSTIQLGGNINILNSRYTIDGYISKEQQIYLIMNGLVRRNLNETNVSLNIERLSTNSIKDNNPFVDIAAEIDLKFGKSQRYNINLKKFEINYLVLEESLPINLRSNLLSIRNLLINGVKLSGTADLTLSDSNLYSTDLYLLLPSLHPSGIQISLHLEQTENFIKFHQVSLRGWYGTFLIKLNGSIYKKQNLFEPDLDIFLNYQNSLMSEVYKNIFLRGNITLQVNLNKQYLKGQLHMDQFDLKYRISCDKQNQELCPYYEINNLYLKLPFNHNLDSISQVTYQAYRDINLPEKNFSIKSIKSNYSLDNAYFENGFYFLGSPLTNAIEGYIEYKDNILWIPYLQFFSILKNQFNGTIELKNFYFNLSDMKPENMQMAGKLYILNFDLNALFPKAKSVFKGTISGFSSFRINNFKNLLNNLELKLSIYQISKDFAGFVVRIIAPTIVAMVVNNLLTIDDIDFELKNGLVYSNIIVKSSGFFSLSRLIQLSDNEIKQERIPLMEFLKRSEKEVKKELE